MDGNVDLGTQLERTVTELVESGLYGSRDDVLREGVKLVQAQARLASLDAAIARGIADADAGRVYSAEEVRTELMARYAAWPPKDL